MKISEKLSKKFSKPTLSRLINGDLSLKSAPEAPKSTRLDIALTNKYPEYNRSILQKFIKNSQVSVNNSIITKPNSLVTESDDISLVTPEAPQKVSLPILYEDENVIVVDKPAGILTMSKGALNLEPTVADFVGGAKNLAHRLDRGTSGVLIAAKNPETLGFLQKQFQNRKAHKTYYAITTGIPKLPEALIDLPLARNLKSPTTFVVDPAGKPSTTRYKVIKTNDKYALIELKPTTGRTHQLRVHLTYIGAPILGDPVYNPAKTPKTRLMLHAAELEITLPGGLRKTFTSEVPQEFDDVFSK